jgi:hypothetical protein
MKFRELKEELYASLATTKELKTFEELKNYLIKIEENNLMFLPFYSDYLFTIQYHSYDNRVNQEIYNVFSHQHLEPYIIGFLFDLTIEDFKSKINIMID